jgi:putative transcriptional regulator
MKKYKSRIAKTVHEDVSALHKLGLVEKETMRKFDTLCLTRVDQLSALEIKAIRESNNVSQGVFAAVLNVRPTLVSQWERGEKRPSGPSLKLLSLVREKGLDAIR